MDTLSKVVTGGEQYHFNGATFRSLIAQRDELLAALREIDKLHDTAYLNRDFGQQVGLIARNAIWKVQP